MTALIFIAATLATFRLTRLITDDKITDWLRYHIISKAPRAAKKKVKQGITCPFCVSFWIGSAVTGFLFSLGVFPALEVGLWLPAIWGGSVIFNQIFVKLSA